MYTCHTHSQFTDGAKISKPKNLSASSNATKSTLHPLTNNKDDEINHRGDKIKKGVLSTNNAVKEKGGKRGKILKNASVHCTL